MGDKRTFVQIGQAHIAANSRASFATRFSHLVPHSRLYAGRATLGLLASPSGSRATRTAVALSGGDAAPAREFREPPRSQSAGSWSVRKVRYAVRHRPCKLAQVGNVARKGSSIHHNRIAECRQLLRRGGDRRQAIKRLLIIDRNAVGAEVAHCDSLDNTATPAFVARPGPIAHFEECRAPCLNRRAGDPILGG